MKKTVVGLTSFVVATVFFFAPHQTFALGVFFMGYGTPLVNVPFANGNPNYGATTTAIRSASAGTTLFQTYCVNVDNGGNAGLLSLGVNSSAFGSAIYSETQFSFSGVSGQFCHESSSTLATNIVAGQQYFVQVQVNGLWAFMTASLASSTSDFYEITDQPSVLNFNINSATSSGLYSSGGLNFASSSISCATGNIFTDGFCTAISFLFTPDPEILNQYVLLFATSSPSGFFSRFPASYAVGIDNAWSGLSASSTNNAALLRIDFASVDPATSTPFGPLLPDVTLLSTTTIAKYYPDSIRLAMLFLISAGLWLTLATDIFFTVRNKMHRV